MTGYATSSVWELPPGADKRFIPVELWAGAEWDGKKEIRLVGLDTVTGKRKNRTIKGPMQWKHLHTGDTLSVYERINQKQAGVKRQLFALNEDKSGIGRVYDSRPGYPDRTFKGEVIFPLGYWNRGEQRDFRYIEYTAAGPLKRLATIKIRRLDYEYKGMSHSLKYDWILCDANGRVLFHENYIYSPGKSLVRFRDRLKGSSPPLENCHRLSEF